jgi:hypothetical protein
VTANVLLTTVFKPFSVDDLFGRADNVPELMMAQVTRVQGLFNLRAWHSTSGLHLIGANCGAPTTILEWPSIDQFREELKKNHYDYVGISFIPCTLLKMREMVQVAREVSPKSKIVIGGHGTIIPGLEALADVDHVCKGDGVRFMRHILGMPPEFSFYHPFISSKIVEYLGVPLMPITTGELVTGLGCRNACDFCVTSAYFDCAYQPFLRRGQEVYDLVKHQTRTHHFSDYWLIDENFLQDHTRAFELGEAVARDADDLADFNFDMVWSSAENVSAFAPKLLAEIGIQMVWIGYESAFAGYKKNRDTDLDAMIDRLAEYGISTLLSVVLFYDFHTPEKLKEDVDAVVARRHAFAQFLPLSAFPGTVLYSKLQSQGRIIDTIPWEERHMLNYVHHRHPHIPVWQQRQMVIDSFNKDYMRNGPSTLRAFRIHLRGLRTFSQSDSPVLRARANHLRQRLETQITWVLAAQELVEEAHRDLVAATIKEAEALLGKDIINSRRKPAAAYAAMAKNRIRMRHGQLTSLLQPDLRISHYDHAGEPSAQAVIQ